jgi:exodeoxyribonuclease-5
MPEISLQEYVGTTMNKTSELSPEQKKAYDRITSRIDDGERFTGLQGYAGTGKTYLISRLIEDLLSEDETVIVCAPTHKAVRVLSREIGDVEAPTDTIHSFLGLELEPTENGEYTLVQGEERNFVDSVVVVDEASMIGNEEWGHIQETPMWVQWVFVGDPAQLPPVNEEESTALNVPGPELTTVHRQAEDNPIISLATDIRNRETGTIRSKFEGGKGVAVTNNEESFLDSIESTFDEKGYDQDPTHARILAYRNKVVDRYNQIVRTRRYGSGADRFVEGEWIVAEDTWYENQEPRIVNSEEVRILNADTGLYEAHDQSEWKVWKLKIADLPPGEVTEEKVAEEKVAEEEENSDNPLDENPFDENPFDEESFGESSSESVKEADVRTISVLHEEERERYENALKKRKKKAERDGSKSKWKRYFDLRERFARVDYAYATTVHRSQGSTYETVFVDYRDLKLCDGSEQNSLFYVAATRPSRRLALLT